MWCDECNEGNEGNERFHEVNWWCDECGQRNLLDGPVVS